MKSILSFFVVVFVSLGIGVFVYETRVASPKASALAKSKKKTIRKQVIKSEPIINKSSPSIEKFEDTIVARGRASRVIDLVGLRKADQKESNQKDIEKSISHLKTKSVGLEIQKAIVMQLSKKR